MASWRAMKLRDNFDTPSRHGVLHPWSPAGKNEGWRDYADYAPELREYNEQKKATRSQGARARSRSSSRRAGSRSPSPSGGLSPITPVVVSRASSRADDSMASSWRLSYRASISRRTKNQLKQQRPKRVGQLPVFSGISTFTLRNMGITHLQGMGVHPEVTKVFVQQNFLTSFEGWEHQPQLVELHASDNYIESFKGMTSSTTIERLFLVGNPITHCYHYRIMAIAACGRSLRMIDNEPVRKPELDRAIALGKGVAEAIRNGWILDNMPNQDTDVDLSVDEYLYFKKYGVLPDSADSKHRRRSVSRGRSQVGSDGSPDEAHVHTPQLTRPSSRTSATKSPQRQRSSKSRTPVASSSHSVWQQYDDDDDDDLKIGNEYTAPSEVLHNRSRMSKSPARRATRIRDNKEGSPDTGSKNAAGKSSRSNRTGLLESDDVVKERIQLLLEKILSGSLQADSELESLLRSPSLRKAELEVSPEDLERYELADAHRLRQTHAGAFYGWRNVQEMTVQLNQDVYALEKRVERRRHVEDLEHWRKKQSDHERRRSATTDADDDVAAAKTPESRLEQTVRTALRNSLLGTNGEPRTARFLKRAVLEQWAKVLERDQEDGENSAGEETVRMVLDLDFAEVRRDLDAFSTALQKDLCGALGTDNRRIRIRNMESGSVIVTLGVLASSDGRSAMELVDNLKAQAADPASVLRSGVYTSSVKSLTHVPASGSHRATPIGIVSPPSIASAEMRAKQFESERQEMQKLAEAWQGTQASPAPEVEAAAAPQAYSGSMVAEDEIEEEEAALMRKLAEVQERKKSHASCAQSPVMIATQPVAATRSGAPPLMAGRDHSVDAVAMEEMRREAEAKRLEEEAAAKRAQIEERMRREQEEEERIKKEIQEKLRREKEQREKLEKEVEERLRKEFEDKMRREEDLRRKAAADEELLRQQRAEEMRKEEERKRQEEARRNRELEEERERERKIQQEQRKKAAEEEEANKRAALRAKEAELAKRKDEEERAEVVRKIAADNERKAAEERRKAFEAEEENRQKLAAAEAKLEDERNASEEPRKSSPQDARDDGVPLSAGDAVCDSQTQAPSSAGHVSSSVDIDERERDSPSGERLGQCNTKAGNGGQEVKNGDVEEEESEERVANLTIQMEREERQQEEERMKREEEERREMERARIERERQVEVERVRRESEEREAERKREKDEEERRRKEEEQKRRQEDLRRQEQDRKVEEEELKRRQDEERKEDEQRKEREDQQRRLEEQRNAEESAQAAAAERHSAAARDQARSPSRFRAPPLLEAGLGIPSDTVDIVDRTRSDSPSGSTGGNSTGDKERKKKKKKQDDLDAKGRPVLLKNCEIRGDPIAGEKMTAFAKRASKKIEISCTFQWYRVSNGSEQVIQGADKASYVVSKLDVGHFLKVVGLPVVKESNEHGQPVTAQTTNAVTESASGGASSHGRGSAEEEDESLPRLTDWKIEMNPRQEYVDPIRMHYSYAGGTEGNSIIQWFREVDADDISHRGDEGYEEIILKDNSVYQPYIEDVNKRIKLQLTPVRSDGLHGPVYQHIIEPLTLPYRLQEDVSRCTQEFKSRGANFLLAQVDLSDPNVPPRNLRIVCAEKQLKVRNADSDKTEVKVKLGPGCVHVKAHEEIQRLFTAVFPGSKNQQGPITYHFLADSVRSRDIIVLTLRALGAMSP